MRRGIKQLEEVHGNLENIIPKLVNMNGQQRTAALLGVSPFTINRWLKRNGYTLHMIYMKDEQPAASHGGEQ